MYRKIIISILFISFIISGCSKKSADDPPPGFKPEEINGRWKVIPSSENEVLFFGREKVVLEKTSGNEMLELTADSLGIRIMKQGHLSGYFAFAEKHKQSWKGIWNDSLVELTLQAD